jgi:hypothetical protein
MTNSKGSPVVVGGATSAEQVVQNAAAGGITLSAADRATGPRFSFDRSHDEQNRKFKSGLDPAPFGRHLAS